MRRAVAMRLLNPLPLAGEVRAERAGRRSGFTPERQILSSPFFREPVPTPRGERGAVERSGGSPHPRAEDDALVAPLQQHGDTVCDEGIGIGALRFRGQRFELCAAAEFRRFVEALQQAVGQRIEDVETDLPLGSRCTSSNVGCGGGVSGWYSGPMRCTGQA